MPERGTLTECFDNERHEIKKRQPSKVKAASELAFVTGC